MSFRRQIKMVMKAGILSSGEIQLSEVIHVNRRVLYPSMNTQNWSDLAYFYYRVEPIYYTYLLYNFLGDRMSPFPNI